MIKTPEQLQLEERVGKIAQAPLFKARMEGLAAEIRSLEASTQELALANTPMGQAPGA
jgi:hypothetical protein